MNYLNKGRLGESLLQAEAKAMVPRKKILLFPTKGIWFHPEVNNCGREQWRILQQVTWPNWNLNEKLIWPGCKNWLYGQWVQEVCFEGNPGKTQRGKTASKGMGKWNVWQKVKERELMGVSVRLHWRWRKANNKTWVTGFLGRSSLDVYGDCWQRSWCGDCGGQHVFPLMCWVWDKWWDIQVKMTYERYSTPNARPMATGLIPNLFAPITGSLRIRWQFWSNQFDWVPGRHEPATFRFFTPTTGCGWGRQTARVTGPSVKIFTF